MNYLLSFSFRSLHHIKINPDNLLTNTFLKAFLKQSKTNQITSYCQPALKGGMLGFCMHPLITFRWLDFWTIGRSFISSSITKKIFWQNSMRNSTVMEKETLHSRNWVFMFLFSKEWCPWELQYINNREKLNTDVNSPCPSYLSLHYKFHFKPQDSVVYKNCTIRILGHPYKMDKK